MLLGWNFKSKAHLDVIWMVFGMVFFGCEGVVLARRLDSSSLPPISYKWRLRDVKSLWSLKSYTPMSSTGFYMFLSCFYLVPLCLLLTACCFLPHIARSDLVAASSRFLLWIDPFRCPQREFTELCWLISLERHRRPFGDLSRQPPDHLDQGTKISKKSKHVSTWRTKKTQVFVRPKPFLYSNKNHINNKP